MTDESLVVSQPIDPRATDVTPNTVVEWGYNMHVCDVDPETSMSRISAMKSIDELEALIATFPLATRERTYLGLTRMAAVGFARGIARRQGDRKDSIDAARERKNRHIHNYGRGELFSGLGKLGLRLILVTGVIWAIAQLMGVHIANQTAQADIKTVASLIAIALFGGLFRWWFVGKKIDKIIMRFEHDLNEARNVYVTSVLKEYKLAAETASLAWSQLTGREPPKTAAFECLLLAVLDKDEVEKPKEVEVKVSRWNYLNPKFVLERFSEPS